MISRRLALTAGALLAAGGLWLTASALLIPVKAAVAQFLLLRAWDTTLVGGEQVRPWPWADTWPVARLRLPDQDADLIVLAGVSGQALAFGPGHVPGTANPGGGGISMIGGHRDTHLSVLSGIRPGHRVEVQRADGTVRRYLVVTTSVADARQKWILPAGQSGVVLVTCYPFDAVRPGGPLRFVVHAVEAGSDSV
ncbi:MAG: class GN sortase [Alphaproteobacteria bacterium]